MSRPNRARRVQHRVGRELRDPEKKELRGLREENKNLRRENAYLKRLLVEAGIFASTEKKAEPESEVSERVVYEDPDLFPAEEVRPGSMICPQCSSGEVTVLFLGPCDFVICKTCHWRAKVA